MAIVDPEPNVRVGFFAIPNVGQAPSALICVIFTEVAAGEECGVNPPARKLSLSGAIQATIDNNVICGC